MATLSSFDADAKGRPRSAAEIVTGGGTRIYLLPVETFPEHVNNLYLVDHPEHRVLIDVGTAGEKPNAELDARFAEIRARFGVRTRLGDLTEAVVSHAHIDHFGNAHRLRELGVPLAIHELDARVLEGFGERFLLATRDFAIFLRQTGLHPDVVAGLLALYRAAKDLFTDLEPDRRLRSGDTVGAGWPVLHVPGHCPGMVCVLIDDVLLTADQLLARTTPVQRPQSITPFMGLENYLRSLEKLQRFAASATGGGGVDLALGGHEAPMRDPQGRIDATVEHHRRRLHEVVERCRERPLTVAELSLALFGEQRGYGVLLALSEAGAHVEYLHELGYLGIENLDEVARDPLVPPRYLPRRSDPHPVLARSGLRFASPGAGVVS